MATWNRLKQPPPTALKTIGGGRLKGMTDINPQWRYQALTEEFGPCGEGWKYTIDELWLTNGKNGEQTAWAKINLYVRSSVDGPWGDPIPGIGGSMYVVEEKSGLRTNDEAYKMAVTDALSVAFKMLGGASDIYAGLWDGSKYKEIPQTKKNDQHNRGITEKQANSIKELIDEKNLEPDKKDKFSKWLNKNKAKAVTINDKPVISEVSADDIIRNFDQYYREFDIIDDDIPF